MEDAGAPGRWLTTRRQRLVDRGAEQMLAAVVRRAETRGRSTVATVVGWVFATMVHLSTLALLAGGVWLVLAPHWLVKPFGLLVVGLAVAVTLTPRSRRDGDVTVLQRADAPHLFGVLDQVADCVGAPMPHRVVLDDAFNASAAGNVSRTLTLGSALWMAAPRQARVALLGHELGHFAHRDLMSTWWVWRARWTLDRWAYLLDFSDDSGYFGPELAAIGTILSVVVRPLRAVFVGLLYALYYVNASSGRHQEYLADLAAIEAGGSDGARDLHETLLAFPTVEAALTRAAVGRDRPDPWTVVRDSLAAVGADGRANRRTAARTEANRLDDSHPQTWLRLALVDALADRSARVVPDAGRWQSIELELATAMAASGTRITEAIRYAW